MAMVAAVAVARAQPAKRAAGLAMARRYGREFGGAMAKLNDHKNAQTIMLFFLDLASVAAS